MSCLCPACGQPIQERPPRPLDLIDQIYLAFGKCCAGCDYWRHDPGRTRPMGYCHAQPRGSFRSFDVEGPGSVHEGYFHKVTEARHVCPDFQDTFDWTALGVDNPPWLEGAAT